MQRPRARQKYGRSYLLDALGHHWRVQRLSRSSPLSVVHWWYEPSRTCCRRGVQALAEVLRMMKPGAAVAKGTGKLAADDALAFKELPGWRSFFLDQTYGQDEQDRQPGLLIVGVRGGQWQWTIKEPTLCLMLKWSSRTWDEGLLLGEAFLNSTEAPWETDPYESGKRARSRKRGS